jgi:putative membrane protein
LSVTETNDASRRTRLANERTFLAWWRTGLTSFAVCIGVGRVVPGVSNVTTWPYQAVGAGYGAVGVFCLVVGHLRIRAVEKAVDRGEFARLDQRLGAVLLVAGAALGLATIALVVFGS